MSKSDTAAHARPVTPELVKTLAAMSGVALSDARAQALVSQAEQHFALLRALDTLDAGRAEPQPEYRPDQRSAR